MAGRALVARPEGRRLPAKALPVPDEQRTAAAGARGRAGDGWRDESRRRARDHYGPGERERAERHERVRLIDVEDGDDDGSRTAAERLQRLRAETRLAGERYMESLRESNLLVPGFNDDERGHQLDAMHRVYVQMMMHACLRPLAKGVNPTSVIQVVGMMMAMRMLSPDFRQEQVRLLQPFREKVQERLDQRTRSMMATAEIEAASMGARDGDTDPRSLLTRKWRKRHDDLQRRERGNREMYTAESAAMTELALLENAFWRMREPGAERERETIDTSYRAMRKRLHDQMADDGLERGEVVRMMRTIVGERMEQEPELRLMFNGIAQGRFVKAPPHDARLAGTDQVRRIWTGEFDDHLGRRLPDDAGFTLRTPMTADDHQAQIGLVMQESMQDSIARGDRDGFEADITGYLVGFASGRKGLGTAGLPLGLRRRLEQSQSMIASMDIDGLAQEEQRRVYSNAFVDAIEGVGGSHPELMDELRLVLGDDWQERLQDAVDDPARFYAEQRLRPTTFRQGPGTRAAGDHKETGGDAGHDREPA